MDINRAGTLNRADPSRHEDLDWISEPAPAQARTNLHPTWWGITAKALVKVVIFAAVLTGGGFVAWWLIPHPQPVAVPEDALNADYEPGSVQSTTTAPSTTASAGEPVYVHVTGEVVDPGLVSLVEGDRVADAIDKAGGPTSEAHVGGVNLAALVVDGEQIHVPHHDEHDPPPQSEAGGNQDNIIQINNATEQELQELPGIGPVTAQRIVQYRTEHGGFSSVEDLQSVPGIGPAIMAQIRDMVRL